MTPLESTRLVLLVLHLTAVAVVLGAWLIQLPARWSHRLWPMIAGAAVATGTGVALVVVRQLASLPVNDPKIVVKLVVAGLVLAAVTVAAVRRRGGSGAGQVGPRRRGWVRAAGGLAILNVVIAVAWN